MGPFRGMIYYYLGILLLIDGLMVRPPEPWAETNGPGVDEKSTKSETLRHHIGACLTR